MHVIYIHVSPVSNVADLKDPHGPGLFPPDDLQSGPKCPGAKGPRI
jgi:hypothetical protein